MDTTHDRQEQALAGMLRQLRSDSAGLHTPPAVEAALRAAFAKQQRRQRWQRFLQRTLAPLVALSATATVAAVMVFAPVQMTTAPVLETAGESLAYEAASDTPFIALASAEAIAAEPAPRVVQADVPRVWLAGAGVPVAPDMASQAVRAELLVGANGDALAVRLMP